MGGQGVVGRRRPPLEASSPDGGVVRGNPADEPSPGAVVSNGENDDEKRALILQACETGDVDALVALATSHGGLLGDDTRRSAWPLLLGSATGSRNTAPDPSWQNLPPHPDEEQVERDVNRSFIYYPNEESQQRLDQLRRNLSNVITETLRRHPYLSYFQGFHDIVQVILLVLGPEDAPPSVARLSLLRIRDFMLPTIDPSMSHLRLLPSILRAADPQVERHLSETEPFFALAATLTLYAHVIEEYGDIARLFDFLLAREAVISIYLFAIIICSRKSELLEIDPDEREMLHAILSKLPKSLDLENLISKTMDLFNRHPPESLPGAPWLWVSSYSVLKTTRDPARLKAQTLEDGQRLFAKQAMQARLWKKFTNMRTRLWRNRKSTTAIGFAVVVGLLSWWVRRESNLAIPLWQRLRALFW